MAMTFLLAAYKRKKSHRTTIVKSIVVTEITAKARAADTTMTGVARMAKTKKCTRKKIPLLRKQVAA